MNNPIMNKVKRNELLELSDWTQLPDVPLTEEQKQAFQVYRQALRDVDLNNPIWPQEPQ